MRLMVDTAAFWPSEEIARKKLWIFLASCRKFNIPNDILRLYGMGTPQYPGLLRMRLDGQLKFLRENTEGFTHVLYTDGWDAMFTASLDEIVGKYRTAGSPPMLTGGGFMFGNEPDIDKTPYAHLYDKRVKYRYPSMAGYIAEIPYLIDIFSRMNKEERADDNFAWAEAVREGWFAPVVDTSCQIFQDQEDDCALDNGRLYNLLTDSQPCILHLGGGYVNPETGKDERLLPWARKMGIIQ